MYGFAHEVFEAGLDERVDDKTIEDLTDSDGLCSGYLEPGLYMVQTDKEGYRYFEQSIIIKDMELNLIELTLLKL